MNTPAHHAGIPTITVTAELLPEAWEKAVLAVWDYGINVKTQYDKPDAPPSKDATAVITITNPLAEPRIHKNFPSGPAELEVYRQEVVNGIHDHWIDPASGKWTYTYHQRLFAYRSVEFQPRADVSAQPQTIDQISYIIDCLSKTGYSRRAQAVTWVPAFDPQTEDPPCLQRLWCRLTAGDNGRQLLNMNTHWRSRDLYKAWFMNVYAFTELQRIIAEKIAKRINQPVDVGRYVDISDSLHIYGSYFNEVATEVKKMRQTPFTERAWQSSQPAFEIIRKETAEKLAQDPDCYARGNA